MEKRDSLEICRTARLEYVAISGSREQPVSNTVEGEDWTLACPLTCTHALSTARLTSQPGILAKGTGGLRPLSTELWKSLPSDGNNSFSSGETQLNFYTFH